MIINLRKLVSTSSSWTEEGDTTGAWGRERRREGEKCAPILMQGMHQAGRYMLMDLIKVIGSHVEWRDYGGG